MSIDGKRSVFQVVVSIINGHGSLFNHSSFAFIIFVISISLYFVKVKKFAKTISLPFFCFLYNIVYFPRKSPAHFYSPVLMINFPGSLTRGKNKTSKKA